eukprot:Nk52_evm25s356 gene=Nk52_evmTU25s356
MSPGRYVLAICVCMIVQNSVLWIDVLPSKGAGEGAGGGSGGNQSGFVFVEEVGRSLRLLWVNVGSLFVLPTLALAVLIIEDKGISCAVLSCNCLTVLILLCRLLALQCSSSSVAALLFSIGQVLNSLCSSMLLLFPAKIAAIWCSPRGRYVAIALMCSGVPMGCLLAFSICPMIAQHFGYGSLHLIHLLVSAFMIGNTLIYFPSRPEEPPSDSSESFRYAPSCYSLYLVFKDKSFMILCTISSVVYAMFMGWFESLPLSLERLQLRDSLTWISFAIFTGGFFGTLFSGCIGYSLTFHGKMKLYLYQLLFLLGFVYTWFALSFPSIFSTSAALPASEMTLLICCSLIGFFIFAMVPVFYDLTVELTFPISETCSSAVLIFFRFVASSLVTLVAIPIWELMVASNCHGVFKISDCINFLQVIFCCGCGWFLLLVKESRHRSDADILTVSEYQPLL